MDKIYGWGLPLNASVAGGDIDRLIYVVHGLMAVLFAGWIVYFFLALFKFRARPGHQATYKLNHFKTPTYIEVFVALFEVFLLVAFSIPIFHKYQDDIPSSDEALYVRVVAEQFAWNIHYPGGDGAFGRTDPKLMSITNPVGLDKEDPAAADDIVAINQLHIPVNTPIVANLTSKDVIHGFALPVMRVKQDTIPGAETPVTFEATQTGNFEIACAQLCGLGHYRMRGFFVVETQEEFQNWLSKMAK